ncbi:MAG: DUF3187 family protein [Campylobacterota bacterium]|nr:DUF3187 family protein [Campylobacterota bacterium]
MGQIIKIYVITVLLVVQSFSQDFVSPIHSTNQYINQLIFYRPYTTSSMIKKTDSINLDLSQSNIFQKSENLLADFEITTFELTYYYPISDSLEISFNYPLYYISKGFLDKPLETIHSTLGIETTRDNEGHTNNQLNYQVTDQIDKDSAYFASGNPQIEIKLALYESDTFLLSSNAGIKLPVGNVKDGFTSEKVDVMAGVQLQKNYEKVSWIGNFIVTLNGKRELSSDISSQKMRYFFYLANKLPLAYLIPFDYHSRADFLFTYQYSSAPYQSSDEKFSSYTHLLQFAIRNYLDDESYFDIYFNQNTIPRHNEADVTFGLSYHFMGFGI